MHGLQKGVSLLGLRKSFSSKLGRESLQDLQRVRAALAEAVESTKYIGDSAQQAYLESDPAHRGLPESYTLRYLGFAQTQVESALQQYDALQSKLGAETMQQIEDSEESLGVTVAETLLARDQLKAQISADEGRMQQKKSEGLSREDLTFCE